MNVSFSTHDLPAGDRAAHWNAAITKTYFPLSLRFREPLRFDGRMERHQVGNVHLSHLRSDPVQYERHPQHIRTGKDEAYLITIPRASSVEFRQLGRDVTCDPGGFIIERGDEPYRFAYPRSNDLFVLKVSKPDLAERIRQPDQYCARVFDATTGAGALFVSMVEQSQAHAADAGAGAGAVLGRHMLELLALAIRNDTGASHANTSSVRAAHLLRIEKFIHENLHNADLSPDLVAERCGISKRYLHDLFKDSDDTVSRHVRDKRLKAARDMLRDRPNLAVAEVAYRFGFTDQAQFSRLFRARFEQTPTEYRQSVAPRP